MRLLIAAGALLAMLQTPAAAFFGRVHNAPWCVEYSFLQGAVDCAFYSFAQCEQARSGVGGYCYQNPRWAYAEPRRNALPRRYQY